jgi:Na+/H+ antiporter NhaC
MFLESSNQQFSNEVSNQHQSQRQYSRASHNVAITVLYTVVIHVVAWTGNQVQVLLTIFGYVNTSTSLLNQILLLVSYLTTSINPVIYVMKYKEFRQALSSFALYRGKSVAGLQRVGFTGSGAASGSVSGSQSANTTQCTSTKL